MNFMYRKIDKSDYWFLQDMLYEALFIPEGEKPCARSIIDFPELSKYIQNWGRDGDFGIIVQDEDVLIGAVWARLFKEKNKGYGFVDIQTPELTMALKSKYRNRGLGTQLLGRFLELAKESGCKAVSLSVDKRNKAVNFYKRNGFKIVDELETAYTMKIDFEHGYKERNNSNKNWH